MASNSPRFLAPSSELAESPPCNLITPDSIPVFANKNASFSVRAMVNPFKFLSNRDLKTKSNSRGLTSHKQGIFMNQDLITPADRLLFLESKHEKSDKIFKLALILGAAYFLGHLAYAVLVGAI
jgi:hypothetical protein